MRVRATILACFMTTLLLYACNTTKNHKILSFFFDGVPEPGKAPVERGIGEKKGKGVVPPAPAGVRDHAPYAAKQCQACHVKTTSNLLLPIEELCFKCHTLDLRKKYTHGPLASGGCKVCHHPHGSKFPFLLVSEPAEFCLYCHDRDAVAKNAEHKGVQAQCTECHDAHSSDGEFLLK